MLPVLPWRYAGDAPVNWFMVYAYIIWFNRVFQWQQKIFIKIEMCPTIVLN